MHQHGMHHILKLQTLEVLYSTCLKEKKNLKISHILGCFFLQCSKFLNHTDHTTMNGSCFDFFFYAPERLNFHLYLLTVLKKQRSPFY